MKFFKPTRKKIIFTFLIFVPWLLLTHLQMFSGLSLYCIVVPGKQIPASTLFSFKETIDDLATLITTYGGGNCLPYDLSYYIALVIFFAGSILLSFIVGCIAVFFAVKIKFSRKVEEV